MGRRPAPGRCVYCGKTGPRTWDHVFPRSWYPSTTPKDIEKWKVPSCRSCNAKYGEVEEDLLTRLALCLDPADPDTAEISAKVLRRLDPGAARDSGDQRARGRDRVRIQAELMSIDRPPKQGVFPGFGPEADRGPHTVIRVAEDQLKAFGEKLVRGLTFLLSGEIIDDEYRVTVTFPDGPDSSYVEAMFSKFGETHHRGPGVLVKHAAAHDDPATAAFKIEIWGRLSIRAIACKRSAWEAVWGGRA